MNMLAAERAPAGEAGTGERASGRIGEIEVLRALAILMVLVAHVPFNLVFWSTRLGDLIFFSSLWSGVDLFFAISGFVIARTLLPKLEGVRDIGRFVPIATVFWIRRAWRLWPAAWFWLLAPLVLCLIFNRSGAYNSLRDNWSMAVAGFTNLANFYLAHLKSPGDKGTAFVQWSLSLEEQFYIILPFAIFFLRHRLRLVLLGLFAATFFLPINPVLLVIRVGGLCAGVLLAMAARSPLYAMCAPVFLGTRRVARIALLVGVVALLSSLGSMTLDIVPYFQGPIAALSGALVWVASYDGGYLWPPGPVRRLAELIAARSYSLYLVHIPVYFAMHELWYRIYDMAVPSRVQAVAYLTVTLLLLAIVTEMNYTFLECPLREHGRIAARRFARNAQVATQGEIRARPQAQDA
ncbi:acyltransferase family protein [Acidomonas methanolica]|uniref:Acyltransferase n=1 Tax=Acidomonas methanolica NBRC 104435 TaxID=1231351 RepID=A0A023D9C6_ACIMT|nr:acyltransferase [Acidomonas methanolica]MBU2654204.1 acyltransferase [Acidomonas methanolica]TCS29365.1 peptidoglycan/LPS O-acetylase OafA/YrhL [Acidomonas methanolica]GAJ30752.1 acyltransferase [Acidomonas methanolica NBRC 104435]GBQ48266.1 putative acyltransferase [Acidomonas methanolica]GEK99440.1 acyltransferase [Acidomonas methanolica NBRC 104435]